MSDQNLPDQNKSNQNMNAQPETASDQIAPDDATIDNLFVSSNVGIGIEAPGPATARLELKSQYSGIGTIKLFPNSGADSHFLHE